MRSASPRVTVLMTVYNGLPYLEQAIESVLDQTFTDFEFLIVDDTSTDESVATIKSYRDPRIRLFCNEANLGQARSLNKGLGVARGIYVARLDQDDLCIPERLYEQMRRLEQVPELAAVCSWHHIIDESGQKIRDLRHEVNNYGEFLGLLLVCKCPIWHPSVMFRRQLVIDFGGYDPSYAPAEDFDLWVKIGMQRHTVAILPKPLVMQRVHEGQQSSKRAIEQWRNTRRAHDRLIRAYRQGADTDLVASLLRLPTEAVTSVVPPEELFWARCQSCKDLRCTLIGLECVLENLRTTLNLSRAESRSLARVLHRRLGMGVALRRHLARLPDPFLYPIFCVLSPFLIPKVRRMLSRAYGILCQCRYPERLVRSGLERLVNARR